MPSYFTVLIPWVPAKYQTEWHPTDPTGPFSVLSRGSFETEEQAIEWARRLNGTPFTIAPIPNLPKPEGWRNNDVANLNGLSVDRTRAKEGNTIFIPLPRAAWRLSLDGQCGCPHCAAVPGRKGYWDTLALAAKPGSKYSDTTWLVHRPEHNLYKLNGDETEV